MNKPECIAARLLIAWLERSLDGIVVDGKPVKTMNAAEFRAWLAASIRKPALDGLDALAQADELAANLTQRVVKVNKARRLFLAAFLCDPSADLTMPFQGVHDDDEEGSSDRGAKPGKRRSTSGKGKPSGPAKPRRRPRK
jgi:hypothetical protein